MFLRQTETFYELFITMPSRISRTVLLATKSRIISTMAHFSWRKFNQATLSVAVAHFAAR